MDRSFTDIRSRLSGVPEQTLCEQRFPDALSPAAAEHFCPLPTGRGREAAYPVFPGVTLVFQTYLAERTACRHGAEAGLLEISYCRSGRAGWSMKNGCSIFLGPSDFAVHTRELCADSVMAMPGGSFEGLSVCVDVAAFDREMPELLRGSGVSGEKLAEKFCRGGNFAVLAGNERTDVIFSGFFDRPAALKRAYFAIKTLELLLYLDQLPLRAAQGTGRVPSEQIEIVRRVHEELSEHLDRRFTIEELAKQYAINPTTLKSAFKAVYGDSLAAHMKEHRREKAAALLIETDESVSQIARQVGYESPSRFSTAFQEAYQLLPLEYRKKHAAQQKE